MLLNLVALTVSYRPRGSPCKPSIPDWLKDVSHAKLRASKRMAGRRCALSRVSFSFLNPQHHSCLHASTKLNRHNSQPRLENGDWSAMVFPALGSNLGAWRIVECGVGFCHFPLDPFEYDAPYPVQHLEALRPRLLQQSPPIFLKALSYGLAALRYIQHSNGHSKRRYDCSIVISGTA